MPRPNAALFLCASLAASSLACASAPRPTASRPPSASAERASTSHVDLSWLSITNVYFQIGALNVLTDGYVTRIPQSAFVDQSLVHSRGAVRPDSAAVARVVSALGG